MNDRDEAKRRSPFSVLLWAVLIGIALLSVAPVGWSHILREVSLPPPWKLNDILIPTFWIGLIALGCLGIGAANATLRRLALMIAVVLVIGNLGGCISILRELSGIT